MGKRSNVRAACAFVFIVTSLGAAFGACTQYRGYDGDQCLKDEDCLGGTCVAFVCTASGPTFSGQSPATDAATTTDSNPTPASDSGGDTASPPADAGDDGPAVLDSGSDSNSTVDAAQDSADAAQANDAASATDASNEDVTVPGDSSDDASGPADATTGVRETQPDSLPA